MSLLVDTGVWSLLMRRDQTSPAAEVRALIQAIERGEMIVTAGLILQEVLQGFAGPKACDEILERFSTFPVLMPDRDDHVGAAALRNDCRRAGVQIGTIDALLVRLCARYDLTLLTTDNDFKHAAKHVRFKLWQS